MTPLFAQVTNTPGTNAAGTNALDTNVNTTEPSAGEALADGPEDGAEAVTAEPTAFSEFLDSGAIGLLIDGGFFMWPILIMAIVALAVIGLVLGGLNNPDDRLYGAVAGLAVGAVIGLVIAALATVVSGLANGTLVDDIKGLTRRGESS